MKRKMVAVGGGVLAVALLGIGGWYVAHTKATEAELSRAIAAYESHKPVPVSFVVTVPPNTPKDQVLYVSGSVPALGNWDAAGVPLTRSGDDGKYTATVPDLLHGIEYKFKVTRGTWGTVETAQDGRDITDRTFTAAQDASIIAEVQEWRDQGQAVPGRVTMTGNIIVHKNALKSKILGNARTLVVFLPPDYEKNKQQRYPTIYFQDGQNLFDEATSYQGIEWRLDETAQRLMTEGRIKPAILIGVFNSEQRTPEFTPPFAAGSIKEAPKGDAYARMLAEEAKPFIDNAYRTAPDRANTMIGGGSMGAMIALYAARQHNEVFGHVIVLSPWLRVGEKGDKVIIEELIGDGTWLKNTRLFLDMGTNPGHNYPGGAGQAIADAQQFVASVEKAGVPQGASFSYREIEGGTHNEAAWQATAEQVLLGVLGVTEPPPATAPATQKLAVHGS